MKNIPIRYGLRRGFTMLEFIVAMVVLSIALTGMFPLMVVQSRNLESLELRYSEQGNKKTDWVCPVFTPDLEGAVVLSREDYGDWYLIPSTDPWARKLGAMATLSRNPPAALPVEIRDDEGDVSDPGYEETGTGWAVETNAQAFLGDRRRHAPIAEGETTIEYATWTFTIQTPGYYRILATWSAATDQTQAGDACFDIYRNGVLLDQIITAQNVLPDGPAYEGRPWHALTTKYLDVGTLQVKLRGGATKDATPTSGYVVADSVRIVPVDSKVHILSLDKSFNSEKVTLSIKVDP
jgi:prepilin-type N-terminal cleavage/methylation domain-containing protein